MAFTPDEKYLLATNGVSNDVSVIDVSAQKVIKTIQVGELEFRVVRADRRRIDLLRVITPTAIEPPTADESAP